MCILFSIFSLTLFQANMNRGQDRGPRENADQEFYGDLQDQDLAAILELKDNLNRENMAPRGRSPTENDLPLPHGVPHDLHLGMGDVQRGSLDNLHFPVDDRHIDWNEKHDI